MGVQVGINKLIYLFGCVLGKRISPMTVKNTHTLCIDCCQSLVDQFVLNWTVRIKLKPIYRLNLMTRFRRVCLLSTWTRLTFFLLVLLMIIPNKTFLEYFFIKSQIRE
jgi:hypothetical protein